MRESLDRLLRDLTLVTLALAIALGWALFQVAEGVAQLVSGLLYEAPGIGGDLGLVPYGLYTGVLTWEVGGRLLTFGQLVVGLVELAFVLAVAALVYRRFHGDSPQGTPEPS